MFGAITSKPVKAAEAELVPELQGKGLVYRSPIVRMRQLFDLYICLRPCKAYPGNPLNYKEGIDLVVFRENTEDLYAGVEFNPVPEELAATLTRLSQAVRALRGPAAATSTPSPARSTRGRARSASSAPPSSSRSKHGRKKVTVVHKANVVRATDGLFLEIAQAGRARTSPRSQMDDANVDAITHVAAEEPVRTTTCWWRPNLYGDIISDLCAQMVGGLGFGCSGNIGEKLAVFEPTHGSAPKYAGQYKVNPIATILAAKMMLDWLGETEKARALEARRGRR